MKYLFDTNAVIYHICGRGDFSLLSDLDDYYISFITKIELSVGFKDENEESVVKEFIKRSTLLLINDDIIGKTIDIRKNKGLKLPDSIILATACDNKATLITSDMDIIEKAASMGIEILNPLSENNHDVSE